MSILPSILTSHSGTINTTPSMKTLSSVYASPYTISVKELIKALEGHKQMESKIVFR